jgi:iron complex transport system substrate-binding protein
MRIVADVVAVTHECDHPAGATRLPAVTRNVLDHDGQPSAAIDRHISSARHQGSSIYAHWVPEMVRRAGGRDPLGREGEPSRYVVWDEVLAAQPEVMVLMPCGFRLERTVELAAEITGRPGFDGLPCARSGRVAAVDGSSYFNRPGPRIVDGLEILAAILRTEPGVALPLGAAWVVPSAAPRGR